MDTSVWIDFFSSSPGRVGAELHRMIDNNEPVALTGLVVTEVLQGLTRDPVRIEKFLSDFDLLEPSTIDTYATAASIFRKARSKGIALTTVDTLIAATALEHAVDVFTKDLDFVRIATIAPLRLHQF